LQRPNKSAIEDDDHRSSNAPRGIGERRRAEACVVRRHREVARSDKLAAEAGPDAITGRGTLWIVSINGVPRSKVRW
jgi:hypothetical protein